MANNEKIKVKILKAQWSNYWYAERIGEVFEVVQDMRPHFWEVVKDSGRCILKSDCEIIPSTDLIAFDWSKWESGQYEAIYDSNVVTELVKFKGAGAYAGVLQGDVCSFWSHTLQLRPKVVVKWIGIAKNITTNVHDVKIETMDWHLKLTYSPGSDPGSDAPTHCEIVK